MTFAMMYAFTENFVLSLSHDEVVHGKQSLIGRMPGSYEEKFANLRNLFCWQMFHPGKKLNFMGSEFGQFIEWRFAEPLEWFLLDYPMHKNLQCFVRDLNAFYLDQPALWEQDNGWDGFKWINADDDEHSIFSFRRIDQKGQELVCVINMTPVLISPLVNIIPNMILTATGEEVETVIIDGKIVMEERKVLTADEKSVMAEAQDQAQKAAEKAYAYYKTLPHSEVLELQADYGIS
jgi:1,4-alpha-glucan branching enzyme